MSVLAEEQQLTPAVRLRVDGPVAIITIDRAEARNAVNESVATGIESAVDLLEDRSDLWVGVLTGNGPVFCAGADLREVQSGNGAKASTARGGFGGLVRRTRTKPLIAALNGPALAGGAELALSCDMVVAAVSASIGIPEVKRCLVAGAGGLFRLGRRLPLNVAMQLALTGDPISAQRAFDLGLVNSLCDADADADAVIDEALALAHAICANAPVAVRMSRAIVAEGTAASDEEAWRMSRDALQAVMTSPDFSEGVRAFLEKRAPVWSGS